MTGPLILIVLAWIAALWWWRREQRINEARRIARAECWAEAQRLLALDRQKIDPRSRSPFGPAQKWATGYVEPPLDPDEAAEINEVFDVIIRCQAMHEGAE